MYIFDDVLDLKMIDQYRSMIQNHFIKMLSENQDYFAFYPTRNLILSPTDEAIRIITDFLESRIKVKLSCYQLELQTWAVSTYSGLHRHTEQQRDHGDYNSLLYLNDDFDGGEFYTGTGITIKPKKNRLTFFDGKNIDHGVKKVSRNHRYTMIFWWENTKFY